MVEDFGSEAKLKILKQICLIVIVLSFTITVYAGSQQVSSTLASTIVTNARSYLNESSASYWSDAELLVWINDGILDLATRSKCLDRTENITLITGQLEYTLSNSYIGITSAIYNDGSSYTGLTRIDIKEVSHTVDSEETEPVCWYEWNGKIGIIPLASSDVNGDTITVYLVERPVTVALDESITIPAYFDHILTQYVVARALYKEGKIVRGGQLMAEVHESINRFRVDYMERPREKDE